MKNISIKVYRPTGEFLKDWSNIARFDSFVKEINGGIGECVISLGVPFDYSGNELEEGNIVDILISDVDTETDGYLMIYSGYISLIEPFIERKKEGNLVHLLGHYTKLSTDYLKNDTTVKLFSDSTNGITTVDPGDAADIGLILRGIIDRYRAETVNPRLEYSVSSIPDIGQDAWYSFRLVTYRQAFDKICSILPSGYFWYIDENGLISVKAKPSTPTHTFEFKKHFQSIRVKKSLENIRNFILVWDGQSGGTLKAYSDAASISKYGRRAHLIQDNSIKDITTADGIGNKFLDENKDPEIIVSCEIIDNNHDSVNGYDIESIQPGDTCKFIGFGSSLTDILNENMLIARVRYAFDKVELEIKITKSGIANVQKQTKDKIEDISTLDVPDDYST